MGSSEARPPTSQESLVLASRRLNLALTEPRNEAVLRDALREAATALEFHLDALRGSGGTADQIATDEPRLLGQVRQLDGALNSLLTLLWEAQRDLVVLDAPATDRLKEIAASLTAVAEQESALIYESKVLDIGESD